MKLFTSKSPRSAFLQSLFETLGGITLGLIAVYLTVLIGFGSLQNGILVLKGESILIEPRLIKVSDIGSDENIFIPLKITNIGYSKVRFTGSQSSCSCTTPDDVLPFDLDPGVSRSIKVSVKSPVTSADLSTFKQYLRFFTDIPNQPYILITVEGKTKSS